MLYLSNLLFLLLRPLVATCSYPVSYSVMAQFVNQNRDSRQPDRVQIPAELIEQIHADLSAVYPAEGCGFLAGRLDRPTAWFPVTNIALHSSQRFLMNPAEQVATLMTIEDLGLTLLGVVHSHPDTQAFPSKVDIQSWYDPSLPSFIFTIKESNRRIGTVSLPRAFKLQSEPLEIIEIPIRVL